MAENQGKQPDQNQDKQSTDKEYSHGSPVRENVEKTADYKPPAEVKDTIEPPPITPPKPPAEDGA